MTPPQTTDRPQNAVTVARRYLRRERVVSSLVAVGVAAAFLGTLLGSSLPMAVGVGAAIVVLLRVPIVSSNGRARLTTTADSETVLASFTGPTPPVLVFQWGIAETVGIEDGAAMYNIPYLFGLRSVTVGVASERVSSDDNTQVVELRVTANQQPWSTYTVRVSRRNDRTVVAYDYAAARRFGLRRIPHGWSQHDSVMRHSRPRGTLLPTGPRRSTSGAETRCRPPVSYSIFRSKHHTDVSE